MAIEYNITTSDYGAYARYAVAKQAVFRRVVVIEGIGIGFLPPLWRRDQVNTAWVPSWSDGS